MTEIQRITYPPKRCPKRSQPFALFEERFEPIVREDFTLLWDRSEMASDAECREWWTVVDDDGRSFLLPGFHFVNRLGYVRCKTRWGGDADDHPTYRY